MHHTHKTHAKTHICWKTAPGSYLTCDCSSYILSLPSLKSRMARLDFFMSPPMYILKYSFSLSWVSRWFSSYLPRIRRRCWYASGKMSRMYGGLFFNCSLGFWQSRTCNRKKKSCGGFSELENGESACETISESQQTLKWSFSTSKDNRSCRVCDLLASLLAT